MPATSVEPHRDAEKGAFVREMFARIAPRYDLTNRVLTAGFDELWRRRAIALLLAPPGGRIVDLCCGTGDLVFHLLRVDDRLDVTGVDFCEPMLARARERARTEAHGKATFVEADVLALPFDDASFDGATMGFSLRNVVDVDGVLREILRVLRPGSRFVNLDVSKAPNRLWKRAFDAYFYGVVPLVGGLVGGSRQAYAYLPSSLTHHPGAAELQARFTRAGFVRAGYRGLMGGAIAVHYGEKP
ncbi:MAG: bifunctional demethylmenaquinone methyltransferase/2-methoxy-6-polyprenyl-1,4-benzoquinol methylase UbiE [Candidatus Eremiobacteraeota bacterium]|nr:bifunctional demethylmenaquinone methyltransferase/2-methoxy-6-polyprenyl-1,4-benzoquinol methylase UbiE [Candidatus Eremiobacteraeota bacterium]MBV8374597.1 bifunctional demethylmenaquinone methyltransferase/2-methoxy-6-polyprenyl-1,4-benzoquinol methylase UbiE [Candidatus Eremiobacteraeota bacterium]